MQPLRAMPFRNGTMEPNSTPHIVSPVSIEPARLAKTRCLQIHATSDTWTFMFNVVRTHIM